jgi:glycosyltransferase involved in cell wall biosynthesis
MQESKGDNVGQLPAASIPVTVVLPVKNEEKNLPICLSKLRAFKEVIVVDSSSTDRTREIAESWGARLLNFEWKGGFPKKRNWVLLNYRFSTEWVLLLDADEFVNDKFLLQLQSKIQEGRYVAYWLNYRNYFRGRLLKHGVPQRRLALLKVGAGLYERIDDTRWSELDMEVHEHPIISGPIGEIKEAIDHHDYRGLYQFIARHNAYSTWEANRYLQLRRQADYTEHLMPRQIQKYGLITRWWFPLAYFLLTYVIRGGFLDGRAGFVYALFKANYYLEVQEKISELAE